MVTIVNFLISRSRSMVGLFLFLFLIPFVQSQSPIIQDGNSFEHVFTSITDDQFPESSFLTTREKDGKFAVSKSNLIERLAKAGKIDISGLQGKWEHLSYLGPPESKIVRE